MRLIFETDPSLNTSLATYELLSAKLTTAVAQFDNIQNNLKIGAADISQYEALFNFFVTPYTYQNTEVATAQLFNNDLTLAKIYDITAQLQTLTYTFQISTSTASLNTSTLQFFFNLQWSLACVLVVMYTAVLLWQGLIQSTNFFNKFTATVTMTTQRIMYSWILLSFDKVETVEESIVLAFLWPWCFLIVFTHLMTVTDHTALFGFSEWGLPVTYGIIMLLEHCWSMGTYLFVYIAGAAGRKYSLITALEDAVALLILIARVLLQAVRGVIVGMFHFICREMIWNMSGHWTHNNVMNSSTAMAQQQLSATKPLIQLLFDGVVTGGSFVIITAVMFLQLLFLLVSVWLFCKCWFTSWRKC